MKTKLAVLVGVTSLATSTLLAGPFIVVQPPTVVVQAPAPVVPVAPVVTVGVGVPDSYVWDGYEYVGWVGNQYYYLGSNHVWLGMDGPRFARFNSWSRVHADWRTHAIVNERYRYDAHGHNVPMRDMHGVPPQQRNDPHWNGDHHDGR